MRTPQQDALKVFPHLSFCPGVAFFRRRSSLTAGGGRVGLRCDPDFDRLTVRPVELLVWGTWDSYPPLVKEYHIKFVHTCKGSVGVCVET